MIIREASNEDNAGLLSLTRLSPMQGVISLRIDREPDFFRLLESRGPSTVLVAVENGEIVGAFSTSSQKVWVNNQETLVRYLADLKVHPSYRGSLIGFRLVRRMKQLLQKEGADLLFCTMAEGNHKVAPFFQGRGGLLRFHHYGKFHVLQIPSSPFRHRAPFTISSFSGSPGHVRLRSFYNDFFRRYQLGPVVRESDLEHCEHLIWIDKGQVRAAISLMDTVSLKQNVVVGIPLYLKIAVGVSRLISSFLPVTPLPGKGERIRMLNIRYFAFLQGEEDALYHLVKAATRLAWDKKVLFLSIGLHERDKYLSIFKRFAHITFVSNGMLASMDERQDILDELMRGIPFEDFALV